MANNYKEIIESLEPEDIEKILDKLDVPWIDKGDFLLCKTACHNLNVDEASWKLYYYKNTHLFYCYSSCGAMSIFQFVEHWYEVREVVFDWYQDIYSFIQSYNQSYFAEEKELKTKYKSNKDKYIEQKLRRELPEFSSKVLETFQHYYPVEWLEEGITEQTMDKYEILYSPTQNKIIIPHFDVNGRLVGIRGRALDEWEVENVGKYMPIQVENTWYSHPLSFNLYGLFQNRKNIEERGICYVFEAEKSVLLSENFSTPNCAVAICGSQFNKYQVDLLMRFAHPREIILCLDNEEKEGSTEYFEKLWKICNKYKNYCRFSFVYDRKNITKKKDSPADEGEEVFRQLIKERVKV